MHLLDYSKWQNFENVLLKAKVACANNGIVVEDHFADASKMVILGSGANREVEDCMLTRYACYLIAENGDPRKEQIAFAQSYFAVQTRKQELIEERISYIERTEARGKLRESEKRLSQNIYEYGVDDAGFGRIRSKGGSGFIWKIHYKTNERTFRSARKKAACRFFANTYYCCKEPCN